MKKKKKRYKKKFKNVQIDNIQMQQNGKNKKSLEKNPNL